VVDVEVDDGRMELLEASEIRASCRFQHVTMALRLTCRAKCLRVKDQSFSSPQSQIAKLSNFENSAWIVVDIRFTPSSCQIRVSCYSVMWCSEYSNTALTLNRKLQRSTPLHEFPIRVTSALYIHLQDWRSTITPLVEGFKSLITALKRNLVYSMP
jgi:hypothetical protein